MSHSAPILDKVDLRSGHEKMQGSLFDTDDSVCRCAPNPEIDATWDRVAAKGAEVVTIRRTAVCSAQEILSIDGACVRTVNPLFRCW